MAVFTYKPKGVCSQMMHFEIEDGIIKNVRILGGCPGNLLGISRIMMNKTLDEVIEAFKNSEEPLNATKVSEISGVEKKEVDKIMKELKKDEYTKEPVKTQFGYHLIKLENLQAGGESEYEEVKNEIERSLMYQKQSEAYSKELNNLKTKYNDTVKYHA